MSLLYKGIEGLGKGIEGLGRLLVKGWQKIPPKYTLGAFLFAATINFYENPNKPPEELLHNHGHSLEQVCEQYYAPVGKLTGQEIVDMAQKYVGNPYGKSTDSCSPEKAQKKQCKIQCAAYVGSVFKYAAKKKGVEIPLPAGNGIDKCTKTYHVRKNKFEDVENLRPGDIFSSTGNSKFGHSGIYVGKGKVSKRKESVYLKFEPDQKGKHVIIHSTSPVIGYNTLEDLTRNRDIISFCRHEALCKEDDEVCK
ncbi:MAG: hypothetical protein KKA65_03805 [Nanoarchaeota archaeon]|nr:hypothetical protein [Nanoarchaeota archaeon]MBU4351728.1 hypothetical protein [Nanoarchaeota archaeon]MBU4456602.1 hypothetical protein [Nanoarchaeota archaeon]MCG2719239.1 hypothetical protein [Nanoarchaeota archaeon]